MYRIETTVIDKEAGKYGVGKNIIFRGSSATTSNREHNEFYSR
jgi:hypothetical protein